MQYKKIQTIFLLIISSIVLLGCNNKLRKEKLTIKNITDSQLFSKSAECQRIVADSLRIPYINLDDLMTTLEKTYSDKGFDNISMLYYIEKGELILHYLIFVLIDEKNFETIIVDRDNIKKKHRGKYNLNKIDNFLSNIEDAKAIPNRVLLVANFFENTVSCSFYEHIKTSKAEKLRNLTFLD